MYPFYLWGPCRSGANKEILERWSCSKCAKRSRRAAVLVQSRTTNNLFQHCIRGQMTQRPPMIHSTPTSFSLLLAGCSRYRPKTLLNYTAMRLAPTSSPLLLGLLPQVPLRPGVAVASKGTTY